MKLINYCVLLAAFLLTCSSCKSADDVKEPRFLASVTTMTELYSLDQEGKSLKSAGEFQRGISVEAVISDVEEFNDVEYVKVFLDGKELYALPQSLVKTMQEVAQEKEIWVRTPATILADLQRSTIAGFADKNTKLEVLGFDSLRVDGTVATYHVRHGEVEGYVYGKYTVLTPEQAALRYKAEEYDPIHSKVRNPFGGGEAIGCDFYPTEKPSFENNPMPKACYSLYLNCGSYILNSIESYIALAKESKINTFVIDIKDNECPGYKADAMKEYSPTNYEKAGDKEALYRKVVSRLHEEGFYVVGRITCFKDSYFVKDNPQCAITDKATGAPYRHNKAYWPSAYDRRVWEFNVALAKEAVEKFGFNEINFDYVRFPDRMTRIENVIDYHNAYGESKVQAIQRFVQYAADELHKVGAYLSIDVFGECATPEYTTAYGQYWPALSNVADVMCGMPYPDHFADGSYGIRKPWNHPYQLLKAWGKRVQRHQANTPTPAEVRTWIQAYNVMKYVDPEGIAYDSENVKQEILGLYDAGLTGGYITWLSSSSVVKYRQQIGAYKIDYYERYQNQQE